MAMALAHSQKYLVVAPCIPLTATIREVKKKMHVAKQEKCTIAYRRDKIILQGAALLVYQEAERILRRFALSARPYIISSQRNGHIILRARH